MEEVSYEQFGVNFVTHAVTPHRVADAIRQIAGEIIEVGPMSAGPAGVVQVTALGRVGEPEVATTIADLLSFQAVLPIDLDLEVVLALTTNRYTGQMKVSLALTVRTAEPLILVIDMDPLTTDDIEVDLQAAGIAASVLAKIGDMENEIKRVVARTVNERVSSQEARSAREIDLLALIEKAWPAG